MNRKEFKSILNDIEKYSKIIKESYVFDEDEDLLPSDEEQPIDDEPMRDTPMGNEELESKDAESIVDDIRKKALSGVEAYADEVGTDEYDFFKNIWMTCDKFYASKNKENEEME